MFSVLLYILLVLALVPGNSETMLKVSTLNDELRLSSICDFKLWVFGILDYCPSHLRSWP